MTTLEILTAARALVARGWCQNASARDTNDCDVHYLSPSAVRFCMSGALAVATANNFEFDKAKNYIGVGFIPYWNDAPERTQADVLAAFDAAVELARKESAE